MDANKLAAIKDLLATQRTGWTNAHFWEAKQLLDSIPDGELQDCPDGIRLLYTWSDVESDRIACGEHTSPDPELEAYLAAKWPVTPTHNGRFWA